MRHDGGVRAELGEGSPVVVVAVGDDDGAQVAGRVPEAFDGGEQVGARAGLAGVDEGEPVSIAPQVCLADAEPEMVQGRR
ncbi:hypothetical protein ABGB14_17230 [Nonomuraea sp. B10E15]|uniref:hypothetical protein n=1 Tax=Nonomuraea sp. B10E15 TaxID=3153560 RepID=UPI00325EC563